MNAPREPKQGAPRRARAVRDRAPSPAPSPAPPGGALRLRVATYNIHKGVLRDLFGLMRVPVIHDLRARLHDLDADLVFLQEVQGHHARHAKRFEPVWPVEPQDQFLARSPTLRGVFETAYGSNAHYLHGHHGNALLSRFPIVHQENRDVSDHVLEKRGILHCVVEVAGRRVHCFVVHLGLLARSRERQVEVLIEWIGRSVPPDAPVIVGGDFNDWRNVLSPRLYAALGVQEVFDAYRGRHGRAQKVVYFVRDRLAQMGVSVDEVPWQLPRRVRAARTFPALVPWLRMDRIYQRGFAVHHAQVLGGPAWARLSDHSPLVADVEIVARP